MKNLLYKTGENEYELYDKQEKSNEDNKDEKVDSNLITYKKNGDFRFAQIQNEIQKSLYAFSSNNKNTITYIPIESKINPIRQK